MGCQMEQAYLYCRHIKWPHWGGQEESGTQMALETDPLWKAKCSRLQSKHSSWWSCFLWADDVMVPVILWIYSASLSKWIVGAESQIALRWSRGYSLAKENILEWPMYWWVRKQHRSMFRSGYLHVEICVGCICMGVGIRACFSVPTAKRA